MSGAQTLRALVNERLAAAAEDIFVLIQGTIAEYEEELCRSKQENQRKQQLLDKVLSPRVQLVRANVQIPSESPDPEMKQEITETPRTKEEPEEQSVKQEEEHLPVIFFPEFIAFCVKTEESPELQQRQTEHREETQGEDISSETHFHSETEEHTEHSSDTDWEPSSCSPAQVETEVDADDYTQVQIGGDRTLLWTSPQTSAAAQGETSGAERKKYQCPFCQKILGSKQDLERHIRVHTGEKPYSCTVCNAAFARKGHLVAHKNKKHTGENLVSCSFCEKSFANTNDLESHVRTHTGEKPYSCPVCKRAFTRKAYLDSHMWGHRREKPYSLSDCKEMFTHNYSLVYQPFSCSVCDQTFLLKGALDAHMRKHTGEKPYSCTVCARAFSSKTKLKSHMSRHRRSRERQGR